jgi:hypothetical protein
MFDILKTIAVIVSSCCNRKPADKFKLPQDFKKKILNE